MRAMEREGARRIRLELRWALSYWPIARVRRVLPHLQRDSLLAKHGQHGGGHRTAIIQPCRVSWWLPEQWMHDGEMAMLER